MTATTVEDLPGDVVGHVLRLLDGPALASVSCVNASLRSLAGGEEHWRRLCVDTWSSLSDPGVLEIVHSLPDTYRSYFSNAKPFPCFSFSPGAGADETLKLPELIISAIDVYSDGEPVFSKVKETDTFSQWFHGSPFRIDALEQRECTTLSSSASFVIISPNKVTLSWVVIDPERKRAVNLSTRRAVSVERHWCTGEMVVKFGLVVAGRWVATVAVTCAEDTGEMREVSLTMDDVDGVCMNGKETLQVLRCLMDGERTGGRDEEASVVAARRMYEEYVVRKMQMIEKKAKTERRIDMACTIVGVAIFFTFCLMLLLR